MSFSIFGICLHGEDKCDCIEMCGASFPYAPDVYEACRKACLNDDPAKRPKSGCDYMENFMTGGDQASIQFYGIDCDPTQGGGIWGTPEGQGLQSFMDDEDPFGLPSEFIWFGIGVLGLVVVGFVINKMSGS